MSAGNVVSSLIGVAIGSVSLIAFGTVTCDLSLTQIGLGELLAFIVMVAGIHMGEEDNG